MKSTWENKEKNDAGNHNYIAIDKDKLGLEVISIRFIGTVVHQNISENNVTIIQ
jgi:hypothetical protein